MKQVLLAAFTVLSLLACNDTSTTPKATTDSTGTGMGNESNTKEAKEERNKQTALASARSFENGNVNVDAVFKDADNNFVEYGDGNMKPVKGVDSAKAFLKTWLAAMPDYRGSDFTAVADGDNVMVYGTWKGTWKNDFMGQKPSGKSFKIIDVDFFKFNDAGKITEHRSVQSMNEIARQTGMKVPMQ